MASELPKLPNIPESERSAVVEALLGIIAVQHQRIVALESENAMLKERVSQLEKNSSNSSKPPSSDITKPKSEQRRPGERKIGGQPGHKGTWRRGFAPEEVDRRRNIKGSSCPDCQGRLEATGHVEVYQQAELVNKPVRVTEYRLHEGYCGCCKKKVMPELPSGVIANQLMGPRLLALFGYMKAAMGVTISELAYFSADVLKLRISQGGVQKAIFRVSDALAPGYEELSRAVPTQKALHIDETGWKENGERQWVWVFCNQLIAFFAISKSRGCKVLEEILGPNFLGTLTSDFYSAYVKYASAKQQFCLGHLIRELKYLTTLPAAEDKKFGLRLLGYMRRLFKLWHAREIYSAEIWKIKTTRFKKHLQNYLYAQRFQKGTNSYRLQRRMIRHWACLFRFLDEPQLYQPTNNHAERTLRHLVRMRKISQGSRGKNGSDWTARATSVVATCRIQKRNVWDFFQDTINARYFGHLQPSLTRVA